MTTTEPYVCVWCGKTDCDCETREDRTEAQENGK